MGMVMDWGKREKWEKGTDLFAAAATGGFL
jgi:hypothetical protein